MFDSQLIKKTRKERGMNQSELISGIGSMMMISKLENDNKPPAVETLIRILDRLDLSLNDVFTQYQTTNKDEEIEILHTGEMFFFNQHFSEFKQFIASITEQSNSKYFYYLSGLQYLFVDNLPDEAIFAFNEVLHQSKLLPFQLNFIHAALGFAYQIKQMPMAAKKIFNQINLDNLPTKLGLTDIQVLRIIGTLYYLAQYELDQNFELAKKLVTKASDLSSTYHLSHYSEQLSQLIADHSMTIHNKISNHITKPFFTMKPNDSASTT